MRRVLVAVVVLAAVLALPRSAGASCAAEPTAAGGVAAADVVFVGTVVELDQHGKYATFAVEELWKGSTDGATEVDVRGGPPDPEGPNAGFATASTERRYELGARYLVTAFEGDQFTGDDHVLGDNSCSGTTRWTPALSGLRPADATFVERDQPILPRTHDGSPPYVMIALTTILVAGGCLYLLLRRGSLAHRARRDEESTGRDRYD